MKKRYLLYLLLLLIPINAKAAASMVLDCDKTTVNPNETITCSIVVNDSEVSGGEGSVSVTNGTIKTATASNCGYGVFDTTGFSCVDDWRANTLTIGTYTIQAGSIGTTTIAVTNANVVGYKFDTFDVNVASVNVSVNSYTVTLNNQNATTAGSTSVTAYYGGTIPSITVPQRKYTLTYNYNGNGTANTTATSTYTFGGYYTQTNGAGTKYINADGTGAKAYDFNENKTFYAKWSGGSISLPSPTRTGYAMEGWYDAATNGTKVGNAGGTYTPTANKTLYAHWNANQYTITLNNNGATTAGTASIYEKYNTGYYSDSTLSTPVNTTTGITVPQKKYVVTLNNDATSTTMDATSTFGGYYTENNGAGVQYIAANGKLASTASTTNFTADGTLYAKWTAGSVTLPSPTKEDYVFTGWYNAAENGTKVADGNQTYTPTSNKTLYARFKEILKSQEYEVKNKVVYAVPNTFDYTQSELNEKIETASTVEIYNRNNEKVAAGDPIGTGYRVKTSNVYYDVVVMGDVTGDGRIIIGDVAALYNHYRGNSTLTGLFLEAAKLTGSDEIVIGDVAKLYNFYRGNASL